MTGTDTTPVAPPPVDGAGDHVAGGHGHADHGGSGGHDAGHAQEVLGPVDWRAWGAGLLGAAAAGAVAIALYLASHPGT